MVVLIGMGLLIGSVIMVVLIGRAIMLVLMVAVLIDVGK